MGFSTRIQTLNQKEKTMASSKERRFLKDRLIALSAAQVHAKRARKRRSSVELAVLHGDILRRRVEITACLNLYHEIRGSEHRHGIEKGWDWRHDSILARLRTEMAGSE